MIRRGIACGLVDACGLQDVLLKQVLELYINQNVWCQATLQR